MAKCIRCGKSTIVRGHVKLIDAAICTACFKQLGFKLTDTAGAVSYYYDDIKDGKDALPRKLEERRRKHEEWLEEHPEVVSFMEALDEGSEEDPDADPEDEEEE